MNVLLMFAKEKFSSKCSLFRVCVRCGGFSGQGFALYCEFCESLLSRWRLENLSVPASLKFPVNSLYSWTPTNDCLLRPLVYSLKGGRCKDQFRILAQEFSWRMPATLRSLVFVIPPRKSVNSGDHAFEWARSLSEIWGGEIVNCLEYPEGFVSVSQKKKGVESRSEREFSRVKNANLHSEARIVFADDILTTGSTARAAFKALGEPKHFEVWTIAWRPKLATPEGF